MDESLGASRYGPADRSDSGGWHGGRGGHSYRGRGGRDRSGNRDNRRNHYNSHRGGHRGPRPPGNRFTSNQATVSLDPEVAMRKQLAAMVARVGELNDRPEHLFTSADDSQQRPVVKATQKNITDLATVLCAEANAPLFLKFQSRSESISIADAAGPLAALLVNCAATLPLQTPAYVGLTLAVNHHTPAEFAGFASRCIDCALSVISQLFDQIIQGGDNSCMSPLQHLLRYLALLGKANLVEGYDAAHIEDPTTVMGLLLILVKAATKTADTNTSIFLRSCILNTVPYVLTYIPRELLSIHILTPLEDDWQYASVFSPGIGAQALLLKGEQKEEGGDDEDEDDGDDDEEEEDSGQVCDTLQDLTRCVKIMVDDPDKTTRFTLFTDAPWDTDPTTDKVRLSFLTCKSIPAILNDTEVNVARPYGWEGTVLFGRLPIFGSPAGDDEEDDDGDDDDMDDVAPTNVHTQAYEKNFSLLDRFFIADAIRHCLICHQSAVTDSGVTRGSAKDTAQQIWSICHLLDTSDEGTNGIEYIMVETLLSLILQSFDSRLLLVPLYVSRVLLELVRAQPAVMPQAVAVGVSNLFQLYLPSLVPCCRDNFSSWLAFHLINTDYQWPKAYWDHWANYVTEKRNSRGDFVISLATKLLKEEVPDEELSSIEQELRVRIWEKEEDPDALRAFVEDVNGAEDVSWLRTQLLVRSLLASVEKHREQQRKQILDALSATNSEDAMDAEESEQNSKEDVLVVATETIVRYKSVIRSCIEKDHSELETDEEELLAAGHAKLLETVAATTSDNRVLLEGCLKCLLDNDIVEGKSVVRWLVGSDSPPPLHWWNLAIMVVRAGIDKAIDVRGYNGVMMIDRAGDADADEEGDTPKNAQLVEALTEFAGPLVKATVVQVCQRLSDSEDPKRLTPVEADLVEGLKRFVVAARMLIYEALTTSATKPMSASGAMALIVSDFGLSGEALADSCRDSGSSSNVVEAIIAILGAIP
ncbi:hypothetical protein MHU86_3748 [Fragilaria crotonensis]|nr:hypothetical protein MHU86_3748 [Fragilaria crotonensis]